MTYTLRLKPYHIPFQKPLQTHHGLWSVREGLLVGLQPADGRVGWGEIAPLPWFGTETLEEAIALCQTLPHPLTSSDIFGIPDQFPASQFGFGSAWEALDAPSVLRDCPPQRLSGLLPAGAAAQLMWPTLWQTGYRTFKWKIGVASIESELQGFETLVAELPQGSKLRLDANGGLTLAQTHQWLECCDRTHSLHTSPIIEYLEQPLPPQHFEIMQQLSEQYRTSIALDESVATLKQLRQCHTEGWRGVVVVKPAIAGYPQALRTFLNTHSVDAVFSSVFETEIGRSAALKLAQAYSSHQRAVGFGVECFTVIDHVLEPASV